MPPDNADVRVTRRGSPRFWAEHIAARLRLTFDPQRPTVEEGLRRVGQACIAVRDTHGTDHKNPLSFFEVKQRIEESLRAHAGRLVVVPLPNIRHVLYGRDVGYVVERIRCDAATEAISATEIRREMLKV